MHVYIAALIRAYNKFKKKIAKSLLLPGWTRAVFGKNYSDFFLKKRALTTFLLAIVFFELFYCKKRIIVEISVPCITDAFTPWSYPSKMFFTLRLSSLLNLYSCCKWTQVSILSVFTAMNLNLLPHYKDSANNIFYIIENIVTNRKLSWG